MPNEKLQRAVKGLEKYFDISTREDVVLHALTPSVKPDSSVNTTPEGKIASLVISVAEGSLTSTQILKELESFSSKSPATKKRIEELLSVYVDGNSLDSQNVMSNIVGADNSERLSLVQLNDIQITPAGRDVNAVSLFLNSIPSIEISRCVPLLSIEVQSNRPPISKNNNVQALSLVKFLEGAASVTNTDKRLVLGLRGASAGSEEVTTTSGMELFTAPQMLVNPDVSFDTDRASPVIDKFRPFMSIEKLTIDVTPQVGFFAYRSANLDITLHDRSRLTEIAEFIKPDLYSNTELLIEYGWSHPDVTGENVFGDLINSMRSKQKYGIVNSSFSFTESGEVKIKLKLFTKGASDLRVVRLADGGKHIEAARAVRELQKKIADVRLKLGQERPAGFKEIRGEQQLFSTAEDVDSALTLTKEQRKQLRTYLKGSKNVKSVDIKELRDNLQDLFGPRGNSGKAKDFRQKVVDVVTERLKLLSTSDEKTDPFLTKAREKLNALNIQKPVPQNGYVSFGRLMSMFVGVPLASQGKYKDVQLIFYPFNAKAGAASQLNISEFVISMPELRKAFKAIAVARRGVQIPLRDFVQFIANNFIDDMTSFSYGLKGLYNNTIDASGQRTVTNTNLAETQLQDRLNFRLKKSGVQDGIFKMPMLDIIIETVPGGNVTDGLSDAAEKESTILKIHFIDRVATPYESLGQIMLASREEDLRTLGNLAQQDASGHKAAYNKFLAAAKSKNLLEIIDDDQAGSQKHVYKIAGGITELKKFISSNIPTIVYGTNSTGIKTANFSTIQEPVLSTVHMLRAGDSGPLSPTGLSAGNLPLRTLPSRASVTTLGCPLIQYMQQFFVDFQTGTTIDNLYGVNKLVHEIAPGTFETQMELVPLDAYGSYESLANSVGAALQELAKLEKG